MKWELTKRTAILGRALACGFFLTVLAGFFPFAAASGELPQNIVRLHVVANSDSEEDQAVKLLVRDAVLEEAARWYGGARTMEEASARLCTHLESIAKTAQATLREQGMGYSATAQVSSGGWWRTLSNARSSSRPWSCGRPCGNGCGADGAFSRQGDVV